MKIVETDSKHPSSDMTIMLQNLENYWSGLRGPHHVPSRNAIEPGKIDAALPYAFVLQRVAPGIARMRVAGQRLHDLLKMDARGMPISTLFAPSARDEIAKRIEAAFQEPAIISIPLVSPGNLIRPHMTGQILLLPLRDDAGETTRILGALVTDGETGTRPRRFEIAETGSIRHDSLSTRLVSVHSIIHPAPKEKGPDSTQRPALRLVVNNG